MSKFVKGLLSLLMSIVTCALFPSAAQASFLRTYRAPRVAFRVSTSCASALTSTRAMTGLDDAKLARERFEDFRKNRLGELPTTEATFAVVATSRQLGQQKTVARRAYGVERSFMTAGREDAQIVAVAHLADDQQIQRFFDLAKTTRSALVDQQYRAYLARPALTLNPIPTFIDAFQYVPTVGFIGVVAGFHMTMSTWVYSLFYTVTTFGNWRVFPMLAMTGVVSAMGANDFPIRWYRSWDRGVDRLQEFVARAIKRDRAWAYWSRDYKVSPEFLSELLQSTSIAVSTLEDEDRRELTSGLARVLANRKRKQMGLDFVHFGIDALMTKTENGHEMSLVIRALPRKSPRTAAAGAPFAPGALASEPN